MNETPTSKQQCLQQIGYLELLINENDQLLNAHKEEMAMRRHDSDSDDDTFLFGTLYVLEEYHVRYTAQMDELKKLLEKNEWK